MKIKENITICSRPHERFGFFGWPSVACMPDGTIIVVASGLRYAHICPWGKTVMFKSHDGGKTWEGPTIINNTPLDDRDAGIISLGGQRLAVTWFTCNIYAEIKALSPTEKKAWIGDDEAIERVVSSYDDQMVEQYLGSWLRVSEDGGEYWGPVRRVPVSSPHGFIVLNDGSWLYFGKRVAVMPVGRQSVPEKDVPIIAVRSTDEGRSWQLLGEVPNTNKNEDHICEGHVVELGEGEFLGAVRVEKPYHTAFSRSADNGQTWTELEDSGIASAPPHFLRHSSGAIICSYGYRAEPYGERARISYDNGQTFPQEVILREGCPYGDLGYAASAELPDGSIITVYYENVISDQYDEKRSLLATIWEL